MNWLRLLLGLCQHKYEVMKYGKTDYKGHFVGYWYDSRCSKCGKIKRNDP